MELVRQKVPQFNDEVRPRVENLASRVQQLSSALHELSHELHPLTLEQLGLVQAIRSLCNEVSQAHELKITFIADNPPAALPPDIALCLYRIVQESLRNVVRHSGATCAEVTLQQSAISLRIVDAGSGFDPVTLNGKGGLGHISMSERLRLVGGVIHIDSQPSHGTKIVVFVPLSTATADVQSEVSAPSLGV